MKTFRELKLGDVIWSLNTGEKMHTYRDQYGNQYGGHVLNEHHVVSLTSKEGKVLVNNRDHYGRDAPLVAIPKDNLDESTFSVNEVIYFSDQSIQRETVRKAVLDFFEKLDQSIVKLKATNERIKEEMRVSYWDALN